MILGLYFTCATAFIGSWFVSKAPSSPTDAMRDTGCNPSILLPREVIDWISLMVQLDRCCPHLWCMVGMSFAFYSAIVVFLSWVFGMILFKGEGSGESFGWGLLLYIGIEMVIATIFGCTLWYRMMKRSKALMQKYRELHAKGEDQETMIDVLKAESDNS